MTKLQDLKISADLPMLQSFLNFPPIPRIRSGERIRGIDRKLRKLHNISRQKAGLVFNGAGTNF